VNDIVTARKEQWLRRAQAIRDLPTRVVNLRREPHDVYIGRPGKGQNGYFGNPFGVQEFGTAAMELYETYFRYRIKTDTEFSRRVLDLQGKTLGCFCRPGICHGDVIVEWLHNNEMYPERAR
jgi:hypothetical protein